MAAEHYSLKMWGKKRREKKESRAEMTLSIRDELEKERKKGKAKKKGKNPSSIGILEENSNKTLAIRVE